MLRHAVDRLRLEFLLQPLVGVPKHCLGVVAYDSAVGCLDTCVDLRE
jgi:hypothetical protein